MRVMTTSHEPDLHDALRLNEQLLRHGVEHYLFVPESQHDLFAPHAHGRFALLHQAPGDGGGAGRSGSMHRWHVHAQMIPFVEPDDTVLNIDSDVFFVNEAMIDDLKCVPGETLGFTGDTPGFELLRAHYKHLFLVDGKSFFHMSGMIHGASGNVYRKAMDHPQSAVWEACQLMLDSQSECADDVIASYFYQVVGGATKVRHLQYNYKRFINPSLPKLFNRKDVDVIC